MGPQHPFARAPYTPGPPPPNYVGPRWAAPGPYRPLPARQTSGCLQAAIVVLILFVGAPILLIVVLVVVVAALPNDAPRDDADAVKIDPGPLGSAQSPHRKIAPAELDAVGLEGWSGRCWAKDEPMQSDNVERRSSYWPGYMNKGTAKRMRGRVAVVHLMLASPSLPWTMGQSKDVHRGALLAARFMEEQSQRHGVLDLEYVPMAWLLSTAFTPPSMDVDKNHRLTNSKELVKTGLREAETTLGAAMSKVATGLKKEGFDEVAFLVHVNQKVAAREFAYPSPLYGFTDVAVMFREDLFELGYTSAHETMHLFGANDLYPLEVYDDADANDVMRINCPLSTLRVNDMTAYAIGWREDRPVRAYQIK